ncbi:MAG: response regulator transcription factor [Marmoricola sp.]|nr:response regulator transcription factor [Marmoricola sp.]
MRVLVVEDESRLAAALEEGLEAEGFAVDLAREGEEGLWLAREHEYDVILLDLMLPRRNGFDVCRSLRDESNWTPIIMLTANDAEWDQVEALDTGADDYVMKPFSFDVVLARIRALVRRGVAERPGTLSLGDLVLDPARRRVTRAGQEVELTSREFVLLEYLMRQSGLVVTKQQIMDSVWDLAYETDSNIVEVYVGRLRRKIDKPFGRHSIATVRGTGYLMRAEP